MTEIKRQLIPSGTACLLKSRKVFFIKLIGFDCVSCKINELHRNRMFSFAPDIPVPAIVLMAVFPPVDPVDVLLRCYQSITFIPAQTADVEIADLLVILRSTPGALLD